MKCVKCEIEKSNGGFRQYSNGKFSNTCKNCLNVMDGQRKKNLRKKYLETAIFKCALCNVDKTLKHFTKLKKNYKKKVCLDCYTIMSSETNKVLGLQPNPIFLRDQKNKWCANECKSNMNYRIKKSLAARLRTVLHKETSTMTYIGCPIQYLREWFEYVFTSDMSWDNYGSYWNIDHIIPVDLFDLTDEKKKMICWNWTNLAPQANKIAEGTLKVSTNCSKRNSIDKTQVESIKNKLIKFKEEGSTTKWFSNDYIVIFNPYDSIIEKYGSQACKTAEESQACKTAEESQAYKTAEEKIKTI